MANFNLPALTSTYTNFITELKARDNDIASLFSSGSTFTGTYPVRAIRWNSGSSYFERRNAANNGWERLEGASGTHKFVNLETGALTATNGATITGGASATGQIQANNFNVTGTTKPANGFYLPSANQLRFTTNSGDRLTIKSTGEVGVNITDPAEKLHVVGNARIVNGSSTVNLDIGKSGGGNHASNLSIYSDNESTYSFQIARASGTNGTTQLLHNGTGAFSINAVDAADLKLATQGTTRLVCDSGGFVGIGDFADPTHNLHIKRNDASGNFIRLQNTEGSAYLGADADKLLLRGDSIVFGSEAGSDRAFINSNGFAIGGTNAHLVKFNVLSSGQTYGDPSNNDVAGAYIYNSNSTSTGHAILALRSNSASGGDPFISLDVNGVAGWHVGVDNSDGDKFKIGTNWNIVGLDSALVIDRSKNSVFSGTVTATSFSGSGANVTDVNATTLDSIDSGSFLRSDQNDNCTGAINFTNGKIGLGVLPASNFNTRACAIAFGDNDTGIAQNGDGRLELWSNNAERILVHNDVITFYGSIIPSGTRNLGSTSARWENLYINDLNMSNKGKQNDVDGTWGDYTIQEGLNDLYVINHRNGKKYKINMTEVDM